MRTTCQRGELESNSLRRKKDDENQRRRLKGVDGVIQNSDEVEGRWGVSFGEEGERWEAKL